MFKGGSIPVGLPPHPNDGLLLQTSPWAGSARWWRCRRGPRRPPRRVPRALVPTSRNRAGQDLTAVLLPNRHRSVQGHEASFRRPSVALPGPSPRYQDPALAPDLTVTRTCASPALTQGLARPAGQMDLISPTDEQSALPVAVLAMLDWPGTGLRPPTAVARRDHRALPPDLSEPSSTSSPFGSSAMLGAVPLPPLARCAPFALAPSLRDGRNVASFVPGEGSTRRRVAMLGEASARARGGRARSESAVAIGERPS